MKFKFTIVVLFVLTVLHVHAQQTKAVAGKVTDVINGNALPGKSDVGDYAFDAPELILPVPQREIDVNENLTQNEGY